MSDSERDDQPFYRPKPHEIEDLIATARNHPLGVDFFLEGDLGCVAITFGANAFTVEAARDQLKEEK